MIVHAPNRPRKPPQDAPHTYKSLRVADVDKHERSLQARGYQRVADADLRLEPGQYRRLTVGELWAITWEEGEQPPIGAAPPAVQEAALAEQAPETQLPGWENLAPEPSPRAGIKAINRFARRKIRGTV